MSYIKVTFEDSTFFIINKEDYDELSSNINVDNNGRTNKFFSLSKKYDDEPFTLKIKSILEQNMNNKIISKIEWFNNNDKLLDTLEGTITYNWYLMETPRLQENLNFSLFL